MPKWSPLLASLLVVALLGCDTGISGLSSDNLLPETSLSVRDTSLVDNIGDESRLSSTVFASWSGDDPDGFIAAFEIRFFQTGSSPPAEALWSSTTRNDSLLLLPIPRGERIADVVVEVRAIDNVGGVDPTPARTVFPIQNAPPEIQFSMFELPPDTTFEITSFAWRASDPEGPENIQRIEVSLNDSTDFTALPPDVDFVTLVGQNDREDPAQLETDARVFTGRGYQSSELRLPRLRLNNLNTFYLRVADQTDTTSTIQSHTWFVKKSRSDILYVNDYRTSPAVPVHSFHLSTLQSYLPAGTPIDYWDISVPFSAGSAGNVFRSNQLPSLASPTLREWLAGYKHIYYVAVASTNSISRNNLPFVAGAMDKFFENGGSVMVHTPITIPNNVEDNLGNPAILLLPFTDFVEFPDSLLRSLRILNEARVTQANPLPGIAQSLPELASTSIIINALPYVVQGTANIPIYASEFQYATRGDPPRRGEWFGSPTVASISADQRVGLFSLPLVNSVTGVQFFVGADGDPDAPKAAIRLMLESLGFPKG